MTVPGRLPARTATSRKSPAHRDPTTGPDLHGTAAPTIPLPSDPTRHPARRHAPGCRATSLGDPVTERPPDNPLVEAARELAADLLPLTGEPSLQRHVLVTLARTLRQALARERDTDPHAATTPPALRRARALACAIGSMPPSNEPTVLVADLRIFARLTLGECADLLNCPRSMLGRVWRATRSVVFASARAILLTPLTAPHPRPDS